MIRPAAIEDVPQMRFAAEPSHREVPEWFFAEWLASAAGFVAVDDAGHVIGQVLYRLAGEDAQRVVYFFLLHVLPEHRRRGIASSLTAAVEDVGRAAGCAAATLGVEIGNEAAREFYERRGYVVFGERTSDVTGLEPALQVTEHMMALYLEKEAAA